MKQIGTILHNTPTAKRHHVLNTLAITMVSAKILVKGGIFNDPSNAHKVIKVLKKSEQITFRRYAIPEINSYQHFYSLKNFTNKFHVIHQDTLLHDTLTAIFLIHLYRACFPRQIQIQWYPPFSVAENMLSDGGITLSKNGKLLRSILIETDTGTHSHRKIQEKFQTYAQFLRKSHRKILFLVPSNTRIQNLKFTLKKFPHLQVFFLNPLSIEPGEDVFTTIRGKS